MSEEQSSQTAPRRYEIVEAVLRANIVEGRLPRGLVLLEGPIAEILQTSTSTASAFGRYAAFQPSKFRAGIAVAPSSDKSKEPELAKQQAAQQLAREGKPAAVDAPPAAAEPAAPRIVIRSGEMEPGRWRDDREQRHGQH